MKYNDLLKKYMEEYNNYIKMGLSEEDAIILVDKHIKDTVNVDNMTLDTILDMLDEVPNFDFIKLYNDIFNNFNEKIKKIDFDKYCKEPKKSEVGNKDSESVSDDKVNMENKLSTYCDDKTCTYKKEIIADTPNHKEFKVTFPNGVYKYKFLMK